MRTLRLSIALCLLICPWIASPAAGDIASDLQHIIQSTDLHGTKVSIAVVDLADGHTLAARHADRAMIPASNMKLLTTVTALDTLGRDFRFRTTLSLAKKPGGDDGGTKADGKGAKPAGDSASHPAPAGADETGPGAGEPVAGEPVAGAPWLIVHGDGDPSFGDPVLLAQHAGGLEVDDLLDAWVQAVKKAGVTHVGRLVIDDRIFDRQFIHPTWPKDQLLRYYCAQVAGMNFYDNVVDMLPIPADRAGRAPTIKIFPYAPSIRTVNKAHTGGRDAFWVSRAPGANRFTFHGTVEHQPQGPQRYSVADPPLFFGHVLAYRLAKAGVHVDRVVRPARGQALPPARVLHVVSATLPLVLTRMNQDSYNLFAECLFKRSGYALTGRPGSFTNGAAAARRALRERLGPGAAALGITDGSGMSRKDRVTARLMVKLLVSLSHDKAKGKIFRASLAWAGRDAEGDHDGVGTLADRMHTLPRGVYVLGKSGYLNGVSALSGYLRLPTAPGRPPHFIAFSFLFNGFGPPLYNSDMKALQERLLAAIAKAQVAEK